MVLLCRLRNPLHPHLLGTMTIDDDNGVVRTRLKLNWIQEEDVRLMSVWLNNSMDPINGNDKKAEKYWGDGEEMEKPKASQGALAQTQHSEGCVPRLLVEG
uniref:Uncharacterized protein n=1 Tax=Oryza glumipatula TaxID=40148 RepID=A0A0E0A878_9ORYZ